MDVERCLSSIGSFGLYQKLLSFVLVSYTSFLCAFNYYSQVWEFYLLQTVTSRLSLQILLFSVPPHERVNGSLVRYDHSHLFPNIVSEVNHNFIISSNPEEFPVTFLFPHLPVRMTGWENRTGYRHWSTPPSGLAMFWAVSSGASLMTGLAGGTPSSGPM